MGECGVTTTTEAPEQWTDPAEPGRIAGWERAGLIVLLVGTAVMYLWNITVNGMGNQFYAAAAQAGSRNWEALLFGSLDSENFITVDKPPLSQWVMGLSGRMFGFGSASMMIPQALMAVGAVALLYAAVARIGGRAAGLLAGAVLAVTPVAALMFRFNNPDAVMVLLMTAAAYCTVRALERASAKWIALAGVALGFAFLSKMLEGLMVLPALGLAYLIAAPTPLRTRLVHLVGAATALIVSSGWYVLLTVLWPSSARPYLAGSTDNSFMNLVLGYNGFARVLGRNHPDGQGPGPGPGASAFATGQLPDAGTPATGQSAHGGFGGQTQGLPRLFTGEFGFEIAWLLPAALLAAVLVIVSRWRAPRTDLVRAGGIVFGGWLIVDGLVLSYMQGTIHPYYSLSIAPAIAGMVAIGGHEMWVRRGSWLGLVGLASLVLTAGVWGWWILGRNSSWFPQLRWALLLLAVFAALAIVLSRAARPVRWLSTAALIAGVVAALGGPTAYAIETIGQPHLGGGPTVGPAATSQPGGRGGGMFGENADIPELDRLLAATGTTWSAAIDRSSAAAALELSTGTAVMAVGGFTGSDPAPTLGQFIDDITGHRVTYYIVENRGDDQQPNTAPNTAPGTGTTRPSAAGAGGIPANAAGRENRHSEIADWVTAHFQPTTVGSATMYDLSDYTG
ncbi:ArnT family glycosyltransferase [Rhodococcus koreensis]|uniref:ArnT family glycosyltransferase n=1 Tax=Rhodococcus koreensis TaxID=99653 RepID=UPI0036DC2B8F